ncbi:MAG: hypothetical protein LBT59_02080 [Clostridiales bacterium]|jgi:AraC-like DNA-binding protein|nr:hypothetical protein [Clostridiales bacterium]
MDIDNNLDESKLSYIDKVIVMIGNVIFEETKDPIVGKTMKEKVARQMHYSEDYLEHLLMEEGTTFMTILSEFIVADCLGVTESALDAWIAKCNENGSEEGVPKVSENYLRKKFIREHKDDRFYKATCLTITGILEFRRIEKLRLADVNHEKTLTEYSCTYFKDPETYANKIKQYFICTPSELRKRGDLFSPNATGESSGKVESIYNSLFRAIAKKIVTLVYGKPEKPGKSKKGQKNEIDKFSCYLVDRCMLLLLGEVRKDPWNVADMGFIRSFICWARDRRLISFTLFVDEDAEWKERFRKLDIIIKEELSKCINSDYEGHDKDVLKVLLYAKLKDIGYIEDEPTNVIDDEDEDKYFCYCDEKVEGEYRHGFFDGAYHDGNGMVYCRKEDTSESEFEEFVSVWVEEE